MPFEDFASWLVATQPRSVQTWVDVNGVPDQGGEQNKAPWKDVFLSEIAPDLKRLCLRDPEKFIAGGIHGNPDAWEVILKDHPSADMILDWIKNKIDITHFCQHFKGVYKGSSYNSDFPPSKLFCNHASCTKFTSFVSEEILKRVMTGAIRVWGKVGFDSPPYLVLPLTAEPSKPRLCLDARFLNLWMKDMPFSLNKLADVSRYIYKGSYMTKCDDTSGYDHVFLSTSSQTYVGFEFGGYWFVCATLPFGWKISPYIYHTTGLAASGYLRAKGIPCSLYIND